MIRKTNPGRRGFIQQAACAGAALATIELHAASTLTSSQAMQALSTAASALPRLQSLVVLDQGKTVLAEAFGIPDVNTLVNIKSVSKSLLSALTGIALKRGLFDSVEQTLGELAPGLIPKNADPKVSRLSIENLLTMQTGLQRTSGPNYGAWIASEDWVAYVLTRPFVAPPGTQMFYSTGDWHVLGAVLTSLSGQSLLSLARAWLGSPLNIEFAPWTRDRQGRYLGGNEMAMSPLNLARFGQLYLEGGGKVMTDAWIQESLTPRTRSPWSGDEYGYGWFIRRHRDQTYYYGRGYGGQFVFVLPSSKRTVVMTSDWTRPARGGVYTEDLHELIVRYCL